MNNDISMNDIIKSIARLTGVINQGIKQIEYLQDVVIEQQKQIQIQQDSLDKFFEAATKPQQINPSLNQQIPPHTVFTLKKLHPDIKINKRSQKQDVFFWLPEQADCNAMEAQN